MSEGPVIPLETKRSQARAADPAHSVWVSANAGAGKTHVLSRRVIRLLLDGVDPARILCLTYTRAAAANMVDRVFGDLGRWAVMDEDRLAAAIADLEGGKPDTARIMRARQLFARALETPGGLKIQTIHAFCEAVLHQFPLEANIAGHFELLDSQMEQALVAEARREIISGAAGRDDPALTAAFAHVLSAAGEFGLDALLAEIVSKRDALRSFIVRAGSGEELRDVLCREFGIGPDETENEIAASVWPDGYFSEALVREFGAAAESRDAKAAMEFANRFLRALEAPDPRNRLDRLCAAFLTKSGEPRKAKTVAAKGLNDSFSGFMEEFERYVGVLLTARDRIATLRLVEATDAALVVADRLIARYERLKSSRGFLDFNDLITRTVNLLARADAGAWVQYKLDRGLDHILLDEAQDTSPGQWNVIRMLAEEFFSGETARSEARRTIFAVGDEKQSIYSFQGAEPAAFAENGIAFAARIEAAEARFERVRLHHSFRSVGDVLSAVDLVFRQEAARRGLTVDPEEISHSPVRVNDPGFVEIWPMIGAESTEEPEDWTVAIDHASQPAARLAASVAGQIKRWIGSGEMIEGKGRRLAPGDVMVLVRKRDAFVHALSRELKELHVNVAGADRLKLRDHIAVKDLIALGRFAVQANDDLSLAALLKSPVFGFDDDNDLFPLAHGRAPGVSLWQSLQATAKANQRYREVVEKLDHWRNEAGFRPVVEFFGAILGRDGARAAMIARLGHEAGEILDEFENFAFACERAGISGLAAFLETLDTAGPEIKREIAQARDEVRIMTVHAAKGLEAPVVFLIDNGAEPFHASHQPRLMPFRLRNTPYEGDAFLWRAGSDVTSEIVRDLEAERRRKSEEEYRRLLYVGMTRAEDRLIVCGYHGVREPKDGIWHKLVSAALAPVSEVVGTRGPEIEGDVLRFRSTDIPPVSDKEPELPPAGVAEGFPELLRRPLPPEIALPRPFAPSGAAALVEDVPEPVEPGRSPVLAGDAATNRAVERGIAIHRMLQALPDMAEEMREAAAFRFLERFATDWPAAERESALEQVMRILTDPRFAMVFANGSRAEVAIAGHLEVGGTMRAVSGKVDRLAVNDDEVLIVDYKTNRAPPSGLAGLPPAYIAQIAVYAALVRQIYPGRKVAAGLLFTGTPDMFVIPESVMEEALERLAAS